jgi:hypothetical protein
MNIAFFAVFCAFVGAVCGYCIADKASRGALHAARAKGLVQGRCDALWDYQNIYQELQRLRIRNRQLEAKEQVIQREST